MITQHTIDKIFETARIEEVIGDFVRLKRSGSSLKGLSPFNNEKTPSFMVSPAKQIFKDFSSGKGGSVVTFLMEHEKFSYPEALRYLADRYNIEIEETEQSEEQKQQKTERESLFLVNEFAQRYFTSLLWESEEGRNVGLSYFRNRGFSDETIKEFKLGYSSEAFDGLTQKALKEGYQLEFLEKTGLTKVDGQRKTDRFRGRVIFPILSHTGRTLGFGGRILKNNVKAPKYLNSPESEIYHKSSTLYGIHQAKQAINKEDEGFLVEGYTDVISLHQAGIKNVVASSGTSLTTGQIALIKRYTENITVLFDGDPAGIKASLRGIDMILQEGVNVNVVLFPEGEDPDSYARAHSEVELRDFLREEKRDFLRFKAHTLLKDAGDNPIEKTRATRQLLESIALIPNMLQRDAYVREAAKITGTEERVLFSEMAQITKAQQKREERDADREKRQEENMKVVEEEKGTETAQDPIFIQEKALCELLLNYGDQFYDFSEEKSEEEPEEQSLASYLLTELVSDNLEFHHPVYAKILEHYLAVYNEEERIPQVQEFLRQPDQEMINTVTELVTQRYHLHNWRSRKIYLPENDAFVPAYARESLLRFKEKKIVQMIKEMQHKLEHEEQKMETMRSIQKLTQLKNKIDKELGRVV